MIADSVDLGFPPARERRFPFASGASIDLARLARLIMIMIMIVSVDTSFQRRLEPKCVASC